MGANPAEHACKGQRSGDDFQGLLIFALGNHGHISMGIDSVGTGMDAGRWIPFVYGIGPGYRLGIGPVSRFSVCQTLFIKIFKAHRTHLGAITAPGTLVDIDIACALVQPNLEMPVFSGYLVNLG
jgi:hypothetical protein